MTGRASLVRQTISRWMDHEGPRLGAALAFYSLLSLAPTLILIVSALSLLFGKKTVQHELVFDVTLFMDRKSALAIENLLQIARNPSHGVLAAVLGVMTLLFGASAVFSELTDALNRMWDDTPRRFGFRRLLRDRLFSMVLVAASGLLIAVSISLAALVTAVHHFFGAIAPLPVFVMELLNFLLSLGASALLFALILRYVPDVALPWRIVWIGASVSAVLFAIGKAVLGFYLAWAGIGSAYGAAGSLVAILVWVYYSAQIFYLGAEFTWVCGRERGVSPVKTSR
ncbi:MAG TPA: YihY/virulence factor BrkB family protein [Bryobacteraceae bacterium]|nr:YihY/virulence factor BrkB family protein [Bryobacteraceae bacterium]